MDESLPADHGEVRPEISELQPHEAWTGPAQAAEPHEPDRPETD